MSEAFHSSHKAQIDSVRNRLQNRRADWQYGQLISLAEPRFRRRHTLQSLGSVCNRKRELLMQASISAASGISDSSVWGLDASEGLAWVASSSSAAVSYSVEGALTSAPRCSCPQGLQGSHCKHIVKVQLMLGLTESKVYTIWGTLHGSAAAAEMLAEMEGRQSAAAYLGPGEAALAVVVDTAARAERAMQPATQQRGTARVNYQQRSEQDLQLISDLLAGQPPTGPVWQQASEAIARVRSVVEGACARSSGGAITAVALQANASGCGSKKRGIGLAERLYGKPGSKRRGSSRGAAKLWRLLRSLRHHRLLLQMAGGACLPRPALSASERRG